MKRRLLSWMLALVCVPSYLAAQDKCDAEIKLLLDPTQLHSVAKALDAGPPAYGQIFFFDTKNRELFSRGVIVRARVGTATNDFVVKVRVPEDQAISAHDLGAGYKCEIDRSGDKAVRSYSVRVNLH